MSAKYQKSTGLNLNHQTRGEKHCQNLAILLSSFLITFIFASIFTPVESSSATTPDPATVNVSASTNPYSVSLTAASSLSLNIDASPSGNIKAVSDTLNVKTNVSSGYKLYLSTTNENGNIYNTDDVDKVSKHFSPTTGTLDNPTALSPNTWGFKLESLSEVPDPTTTFSAVSTTPTKIKETDTITPDSGDNIDISYGFNVNTALPSGSYKATILYTVYAESADNLPTMQDFTTTECEAMNDNEITTLLDSRDGKAYRVTKMKDGNCWMTSNLALDGGITLTPEDSNVTQNRPLNANIENGTEMTADRDYIYSGVAEQTTTDCGSYAYCVTSDVKYGNLYNWVAATAGVGTATSSDVVYESVCPKGWRLPDNTGDYSYPNLLGQYGLPTSNTTNGSAVQTIQQSPLGFSLAGYYSSSAVGQGSSTNYWSRTSDPGTAANAYRLAFSSTSGLFNPQFLNSKATGFAVRCVFEGSFSQIATMQEMSTSICKATAEGTTATLPDKRGRGNGGASTAGYGIIKAKDGNCWMTTNFDLYNMTGDNAIKAEDSDFTSGTYEIPDTSTWNSNVYTEPKVHQATNSGYADQVYYNWTAAVALTNGSTTQQQDQSICPKNWQLPINGDATTDKSYAKLLNDYGITTGPQVVANKTLGFTYSGLWNKDGSGGEGNQGSVGYFWSSTSTSASNARFLYYGLGGALTPQHDLHKGYGFSLRCVSR